jgi:hypothetical protein
MYILLVFKDNIFEKRHVMGSFWINSAIVLTKVKESRNRPGVAQRIPGGLRSQISMTFGT